MPRNSLRRALLPAALLLTLTLPTGPGSAAAAAPRPRIDVSAPQYESPGGTVPAIVTVHDVPAGYTARIRARGTGGAEARCTGPVWHNPVRRTSSRKCYLALPRARDSYNVRGLATLVRPDAPTLRASGLGHRPVQADGYPTRGRLTPTQIEAVEACGNATDDVWLTFDDGGSHAQVTSILATLRREGVRGRFFMSGTWRDSFPALTRRIRREGHLLGNHGATHQPLSRLSRDEVVAQIRGGVPATGRPRLLRPPYAAGAFTTRLRGIARSEGYQVCRWTADTYDWEGTSAGVMVERVRYGDFRTPPLRAGGNLLLHGTAPHTAEALPRLIEVIRREGLTLDPLR